MSSQEFPPASYPLYAEPGVGREYALPEPRTRERYWLYALLFAATLASTTAVGAAMQMDFERNLPFDVARFLSGAWWYTTHPAAMAQLLRHPGVILLGIPFSFTLLSILLSHEFGHYIAARHHRVDASLPYFIPSPFLGTFGAFIRVRSPIYSKRALFDIGVSGPIAGFLFLLPALSIGLAFSKVIPGIANQGSLVFGIPVLLRGLAALIFPGVPVADICLHPVARAAWVGVFTTALNLLPIGQLDGGHILYALCPARHKLASRIFAALLIPLAYFWWVWAVWAGVMLWLGRYHPMIVDDEEMSPDRVQLGWFALAIFVLCFMYQPVRNGL